LDSRGLKAAVAGDERKAKVKCGCGDDAVGHVRYNVARNVLERLCYARIHGGDEQSGIWISEGRTKPVQSIKWESSSFNQVDRFNEGYRRDAHMASISDSIFNRCPGGR
jgi:hypothetical protein